MGLIFGWASLLIEHSCSLLHFTKSDLSFLGGLENLLLDVCALQLKFFGFSDFDLLDRLLDFGDVSFGFLKNLFVFLLALLETMIMLVEDLFGF